MIAILSLSSFAVVFPTVATILSLLFTDSSYIANDCYAHVCLLNDLWNLKPYQFVFNDVSICL